MAETGFRTVDWGIRAMLLIGTAFVTFDFVQLTFLSERTDRYFSWTIAAPIMRWSWARSTSPRSS